MAVKAIYESFEFNTKEQKILNYNDYVIIALIAYQMHMKTMQVSRSFRVLVMQYIKRRGSGDHAYKLFQRQDLVASNHVWDLNLLLSNDLLAVAHDVLCNYCIQPEQLAVRTHRHFPSDWGCGARD